MRTTFSAPQSVWLEEYLTLWLRRVYIGVSLICSLVRMYGMRRIVSLPSFHQLACIDIIRSLWYGEYTNTSSRTHAHNDKVRETISPLLPHHHRTTMSNGCLPIRFSPLSLDRWCMVNVRQCQYAVHKRLSSHRAQHLRRLRGRRRRPSEPRIASAQRDTLSTFSIVIHSRPNRSSERTQSYPTVLDKYLFFIFLIQHDLKRNITLTVC